MGSTSESSYVGATSNPWALDHVPGGSSGGSAAAVAADLAPLLQVLIQVAQFVNLPLSAV